MDKYRTTPPGCALRLGAGACIGRRQTSMTLQQRASKGPACPARSYHHTGAGGAGCELYPSKRRTALGTQRRCDLTVRAL